MGVQTDLLNNNRIQINLIQSWIRRSKPLQKHRAKHPSPGLSIMTRLGISYKTF